MVAGLNIHNLPDNVDELKTLLLNYYNKSLTLEEENKLLRRLRFAHKSEKWTNKDKIQASLFDEVEATIDKESRLKEIIVVKSHSRKKKGRKALSPDLPRKEIIHDISEAEKICDCGETLKKIGEDTYEELDFQPAKYWVNKHTYFKYACKHCEGLSDESKPAVKSAQRQPRIIEKSIATPGLLAYTLVSKFEDHLPFYRQERILGRLGVDLPRATMCNWAIHVGEKLQPLLDIMLEDIQASALIAADETPLQVLKEPGRSNTAKSYMWLFRGGTKERPVVLYNYRPTRSATVAEEFLKGYHGVLLSDGYKGYDMVGKSETITHAACWAHVRRYFKYAVDATPGNSKDTIASQFMELIQKLYLIEREIKESNLPVLAHRDKYSKIIVEEIHQLLNYWQPKVTPEGLLGKAIGYAMNQWPKLVIFLNFDFLPLDNNLAENDIRPFVLGRKNWLFAGSPRGAHASCAIFSIIQTVKLNGLEPYWYLRYLFEKLPSANTGQLREIAPHRIELTTIKKSGEN
ncbi:MAG: IS66 family transposase [Spirochaetia bacterium]|nr:IS66 family transposase [Spirochaetia bacterium]